MTERFGKRESCGAWRSVRMARSRQGWGWAIGDYDLDGHLDLFKTHFADDANGLYRNDGTGNFDDVTRTSRVGVETRYVAGAPESSISITTAIRICSW